ncbi:MAG: hypothetical protein OXH11_04495 [Candidatus Aminicenantes bacterium]|nr:hypothetical protein [Candidatus Aminicenantes bacterium]
MSLTDDDLGRIRAIVREEIRPLEEAMVAMADSMLLLARAVQNIEVKLLSPEERIWGGSPVQRALDRVAEPGSVSPFPRKD